MKEWMKKSLGQRNCLQTVLFPQQSLSLRCPCDQSLTSSFSQSYFQRFPFFSFSLLFTPCFLFRYESNLSQLRLQLKSWGATVQTWNSWLEYPAVILPYSGHISCLWNKMFLYINQEIFDFQDFLEFVEQSVRKMRFPNSWEYCYLAIYIRSSAKFWNEVISNKATDGLLQLILAGYSF